MILSFTSSVELLYGVATICLALVTVFLCWALYEAARLLRQGNEVVSETREKVSRVEHAMLAIAEKIGTTSQHLALIAEGGKKILSYFFDRQKQKEEEEAVATVERELSRGKKKKRFDALSEMPEE